MSFQLLCAANLNQIHGSTLNHDTFPHKQTRTLVPLILLPHKNVALRWIIYWNPFFSLRIRRPRTYLIGITWAVFLRCLHCTIFWAYSQNILSFHSLFVDVPLFVSLLSYDDSHTGLNYLNICVAGFLSVWQKFAPTYIEKFIWISRICRKYTIWNYIIIKKNYNFNKNKISQSTMVK